MRQSAGAPAGMALSVAVYTILGVAGTSLQFAAVVPLFDASNSPNAVVRLSAETTWVALAHSTQHGLWFFEGPVMAFWAIVSGRQLRLAQYTSGVILAMVGLPPRMSLRESPSYS